MTNPREPDDAELRRFIAETLGLEPDDELIDEIVRNPAATASWQVIHRAVND